MTQPNQAPQGYKQANVEIAGFWNPLEGPIHGRLIGGFRFRNIKRRITTVYMIRLADPCMARCKGERELVDCEVKAGEVVGVFHSGALNSLKDMYGCIVWIKAKLDLNGVFITKTVPAGEMKLFDVQFKGEKRKLQIDDRSKARDIPEEVEEEEEEEDSKSQTSINIDDIPF